MLTQLLRGVLLALLVLTAGVADSSARIRTVNPDGTGDFLTIQSAIDAPSTVAGDTIHPVFGIYQGSVTINKPITLLGGGFDGGPGQATELFITQGDGVTFVAGSSGARIEGFLINVFTGGVALIVQEGAANVEIVGNRITANGRRPIEWIGAPGGRIYLNTILAGGGNGVLIERPNGLVVDHNVIFSVGFATPGVQVNGNTGLPGGFKLIYNVIRSDESNALASNNLPPSSEIYNNIFIKGSARGGPVVQTDNAQFFIGFNHYFLASGTATDAEINEPFYAVRNSRTTGDPLFVNFPSATSPLTFGVSDFHLRPGSPAMDTGRIGPAFNDPDGTRGDKGIYGGAQPFEDDGGTPDLPVVVDLQVTPGRIVRGGTLDVRAVGKIGQ